MKIYLQNILPQLKNFSLSLNKTAILINKPWALIDDEGEVQKLIFKKNKELILSKNGQVTEGKWDYFPEAKSLLIDRGTDKILCNEAFIDDGVLIMKLDGTNNQFFVLANENIVPDLDVMRYLINLRRRKLSLFESKLYDGRIIEVSQGNSGEHIVETGSSVSIDAKPIENGKYRLAKNNKYIVVKENVILKILTEVKYTNPEGRDIIIHQHFLYEPLNGDYVFIDDMPAADGAINFSKSKNLVISDGKIVRFERKNPFMKALSKRLKKFFGIYKE